MNKSQSITKLAEALSKAQAELPAVKFDSQNPFLKNKYATLGAVIETSRPILSKYGLSVIQSPVSEGERIGVTTMLLHTSGEWIEDSIYINPTDSKGLSAAQTAGVVISYLRRYSLASFLRMYSDEDTDGHEEKKEPVRESKPVDPDRAALMKEFALTYNAGKDAGVEGLLTVNPKMTLDEVRKALEHNKKLVEAK